MFAVLLWTGGALRAAPAGFFLEIEAANPQGGWGHLFYDIGQWYSGVDSCRVEIPAGTELRPYRFPIPAKPIKHLRFDPADGAATVLIGRIRLLTADGKELASFGPEKLVPMHTIERFQLADGIATVTTGTDDPMLFVARPMQRETTEALGRAVVGSTQLWLLGAAMVGLLGLGGWTAVRAVVGGARGAGASGTTWWGIAGAFLVVFGARLYWLKLYSRPMPFWDEWETDAICLLIPWKGGFLDWEALFIPQGEHRILITRLITLLGTSVNGEWDPRVGMVAGAFFFAGSIALLAGAAVKAGSRLGLLAIVGLVVAACLPFDWRNLFWGDQSQMYALNLLAVCTLAIAASDKFGPREWLGGGAAAVASLSTMGSGLVAPGLAVGLCVLRWRAEPERRRAIAIMGGIFLLVTLAGVLLYRTAPYQGPGYSKTWAQFAQPLLNRLAWPFAPHVGWAALVWGPWLLLAGHSLIRHRASTVELLALGCGAWALVNAAGLAHGRPGDLPPFDAKYLTAMSLAASGAVLSAIALRTTWPARKIGLILGAGAAVYTTVAVVQLGLTGRQGARDQHTERLANDNLVRPFLATGDPTQLRATHFSQLPYWNGTELADLLDSPLLQPLLPAVLRESLAKRPGSPVQGPQAPGPLTIAARSLMKAGVGLMVIGAALLLWCAVGLWRKRIAEGSADGSASVSEGG